MAKSWYYVDANDEELGPVSGREIRARVADGTITKTTQVWRDDLPDWVEAGRIRKLFEKSTGSPKKTVSRPEDKPGRVSRRSVDLEDAEDEWASLAEGEPIADDDPFAFQDESGQVFRSFARPKPKPQDHSQDDDTEDED